LHQSYKKVNYVKDYYNNDYYITSTLYDKWKVTRVFTDEIPTTYIDSFLIIEAIDNEIIIGTSTRITNIQLNDYLNKFELRFELYLMDKYLKNNELNTQLYRLTMYFNKLYKNQKVSTDISPIIEMKLKNNGDDFFSKKHYNYFNSVNSASLHNSYLYLYENKILKNKDLLKHHDKILEKVNLKMIKFKPHNPLVDSFMTIFIYNLMKK
jgi:hypothetical protein